MIDMEAVRGELENTHPGCNVIAVDDKREVVAEIPEGIVLRQA